MSCPKCDRQIAALEEELAAWKALACGASSGLLPSIKTALGISGAPARLLAWLVERPGVIHHPERLYLVVSTRDPGQLDSAGWRRVAVDVCRLRKALRRHGLPEPQGVYNEGRFYTAGAAAEIIRFLDHAA